MVLKRIIDLTISFIAIFFLWPIFLLIYLLVIINLGAPGFFIQERVGKNNKVF